MSNSFYLSESIYAQARIWKFAVSQHAGRAVSREKVISLLDFGSFADSTYTEDSDLDFYIIVQDAVSDILAEITKAYKSIRKVKHRPVDIVAGTVSRFEARKEIPFIENEVYRKGVLLYDAGDYEAA